MRVPVSAFLGSPETCTEACISDLALQNRLGLSEQWSHYWEQCVPNEFKSVPLIIQPAIQGLSWRFAWDMKR